jgi:hypothetical protein
MPATNKKGMVMSRPTSMMPAMVEYGPMVRTVREDAKVPEAKQQAVRIPKRMLSTLGH